MAISGHLIPPSYMNSYTKGELNAPKWPFKIGSHAGGEKGYFSDSDNGISRFSRFWALSGAGGFACLTISESFKVFAEVPSVLRVLSD